MPISKFCNAHGLEFKNIDLIKCALTHSSYVRECALSLCECNERLEFLGDAVLKLSISAFLYDKLPDAQEGELTQIRAQVVSDKTLASFARKIALEECLILGPQEEKTGGRRKSSILACAFEAFLGALFLEFGLEFSKNFILKNFSDEISKIENEIETSNPKAILQEYTQGKNHTLPVYKILSETGKAHMKTFQAAVYYNNELLATGTGRSKKEAQQNCAKNALLALDILKE